MAQHRYRQHKVKREHTIIQGLLPLLERIAEIDAVKSVTPGRINQRSRNGRSGLFFQYKTETGLKLIGRSTTAVQEVFVVTDDPDGVIDALVTQELITPGKDRSRRRPANTKRNSRVSGDTNSPANVGAGEDPNNDASVSGATSGPDSRTRKRRPGRGGARRRNHAAKSAPEGGSQGQLSEPNPANEANEKVEPELWNELLRLHQELLDLEKRLAEPRS